MIEWRNINIRLIHGYVGNTHIFTISLGDKNWTLTKGNNTLHISIHLGQCKDIAKKFI